MRKVTNIKSDYAPYCKNCGSCGEDGCCPDWKCTHGEGCKYPETENGARQKITRLILKMTKSYKLAHWFYVTVREFPFWFNRKVVCSLFGHTLPNGFGMCQRCWEFIVER